MVKLLDKPELIDGVYYNALMFSDDGETVVIRLYPVPR
jgi:hypothetical protein